MKATAAVLLALLAAGFAEAQTSNTSNVNTIKVDVVGLHSNDGHVRARYGQSQVVASRESKRASDSGEGGGP